MTDATDPEATGSFPAKPPSPLETDATLLRSPAPQRRLFSEGDGAATLTGGPAAPLPPLSPSPSIPGYEILGELGRGGMGVVYRARQVVVNRVVALKMILAGAHASPSDLIRFLSEAELIAQFQHPNLIQIFEFGQYGQLPYFTMELLEGGSLDEYTEAPLSPRDAARLAEQIARGVGYAHAKGIIHRDLKPANILLAVASDHGSEARNDQSSPATGHLPPATVPKITDFGLAKHLEAGPGMTDTGTVMGTPSYMAPEQADGRPAGPPADVWAVGAILYRLLTGRPPFLAATAIDTLRQVLEADPAHPSQLVPHLPRDLVTICLKCLQKDHEKRYPTGAELADDLHRFLSGQPIVARPVSAAERGWKWLKRNRSLAGTGALVALILTAATVVSTGFAIQSQLDAKRATEKADEATRAEVSAHAARDQAAESAQLARAAQNQASRQLYVSNLRLTQELWNRSDGSPKAIDELLAEHVPTRAGEPDFREFAWRMQWARLNRSAVTLPLRSVYLAALTPERQVATVDRKGVFRVLDPATGEVVFERAFAGRSSQHALSPDGRFAAWCEPAEFNLFDAVAGTLHRVPAVKWQGLAVEFSPNGKFVAVVCSDQAVRVFEAATGSEKGTVALQGTAFRCLAVAPDGLTVALGNHPGLGEVKTYAVTTGSSKTLKGPGTTIVAVAFSAAGTRLAAGDYTGGVTVWNLDRGTLPASRGKVFPDRLSRLNFSPDGSRLAGAGADGFLAHWPVGRPSEAVLLRGHTVDLLSVAYSPTDGNTLLSTDRGGALKIWDLGRPTCIRALGDHPTAVGGVAFDRDGTWLASAGPKTQLWDVRRGALVREFEDLPGEAVPGVHVALALAPDRSLLAAGDRSSRVTVYDPATGKVLWSTPEIPPDTYGAASATMPMDAPTFKRAVAALAISPDNRLLAAGFGTTLGFIPDYNQTVKVWDARTGAEIATLKVRNTVSGLRFSRDGRELLVGCHDRKLRTWRVGDGVEAPVEELDCGSQVSSLDLSADGALLAIGLENGGLVLRDRRTGRESRRPSAHAGLVSRVAISPDNRTVVSSGAQDGYLRFWEAESLRETIALRSSDWHSAGAVSAVAFLPGGDLLALGTVQGVWLVPAPALSEIDRARTDASAADTGRP